VLGWPGKRLLQRPCYLTKFGYVPYIVKKVTALSMCNGNTEMSPPIPMQNPICTETQLGFDVAFALPNYNFYIPELRH